MISEENGSQIRWSKREETAPTKEVFFISPPNRRVHVKKRRFRPETQIIDREYSYPFDEMNATRILAKFIPWRERKQGQKVLYLFTHSYKRIKQELLGGSGILGEIRTHYSENICQP